MATSSVVLCLAGDVMTGRGIDQILAHPGDPTIHERWAKSALRYVELAERASGPIPRNVGPEYVWGDGLRAIRDAAPDAFVVNLETAVPDRGRPWPGKGIQYRMHPANADVLSVAGINVAVLANNHVLDWSVPGLEQTLDAVADQGVAPVGAGRNGQEAWAPAVVPANTTASRAVVFAAGAASSGIPATWAAADGRPGVAFLPEPSDALVDDIAARVQSMVRPSDVVVMSLHWGPNWGYAITPAHRRFARALIDRAGVDVVHGHSSHHPLGVEVHGERLIIYGCGDLVTDYEGIHGKEHYRGELGALYFVTVDGATGVLQRLDIVPTKMARFRLGRPPVDDVQWLMSVLDREGSALGTTVTMIDRDRLAVHW